MASFSPTPVELGLVNQVFNSADPQKLGIVTGDAAVKIFAGAKLPPSILGEIWAIADKDNNGFLTKKGVAIALRLIGHAQNGEAMKESLIDKPGPPAHIEGISAPSPRPSSIPSSPAPQSPPPRGSPYPPLTAEDKSKFLRLFLKCGPANGLLSGDKARDVFVKSKLPFEKLSQIWSLADTQDRGSLDQTDFTIAMYLIQSIMSGQLPNLPATLPPGLYEQAGGRSPHSVATHNTGNSVSLSPSLTGSFISTPATSAFSQAPLTSQNTGSVRNGLQPQITGQDYRRSTAFPSHFNPALALGASAFGTNNSVQQTTWDVTPEEKSRFDAFFDGLDVQKKNHIEGEVAVPFMLQSKLSGDVLAQVWDLADLNNDGRLTREGFAVAMHLIQNKLAGKDIPASLPYSLVPPAMRAGVPPTLTPATAPAPPPAPVRDLLWDDSPPASATAAQHTIPPVQPSVQHTPVLQSQGTGQVSQHHTGTFNARSTALPFGDPFGPSSSSPSVQRDLLSDDDEAPVKAVPDNSAEIGNLQNQLNSTNKSLDSTRMERQSVEQSISTQASQLSSLQTQLSSAKAAYETETRLLTTLRERFATQTADIQKAREELIHAESDLSAVRVEKAEIEGSVLRDKEEVRGLQRRMKEVGDEMEQMKIGIEKAKKETKHQKGLLAIAKKQLATREAERAKVAKELEDAEQEAREAAQEREIAEEELAKEEPLIQTNVITSPGAARSDTPSFAAAQPLPGSPNVSSPLSLTSPSGKSNNPFERLVMSSTGSPSPRPVSPFSMPATDLFTASTPQLDTARAASPLGPVASIDATQQPSTDVPRASSPFIHVGEAPAPIPPAEVPRAASPFMHVAEASSSTTAPSTEPQSAEPDNPFGFNEGESKPGSETSVITTPEKPSTPQPQVGIAQTSTAAPPDTAFKSTSAEPEETLPFVKVEKKSEVASSPNIDAAAAHFPPIDVQLPGGFPGAEGGFERHTDLNSQLLEREHEESDSDSDEDGVFHDANARLSTFSAGKEPEKDGPIAPKSYSPVTGNGDPKSTTPSGAFDDAFGLNDTTPKPDTSAAPANVSLGDDVLANVFSEAEAQPVTAEKPNGKVPEQNSPFSMPASSSGVNAFDEAMGKISPSASGPAAPQFKLDSAFDDDFDFMAAKADTVPSPFPPAPSATQSTPLNGASVPAKPTFDAFGAVQQIPSGIKKEQVSVNGLQQGSGPLSFDDAFGSISSRVSAQPQAGDHGISFEEAFGGGSNRALAFNDAFGTASPATSPPASISQGTKPTMFPTQSPPGSPTAAMTTPASPSTVRSTSPPPRVNSPKPRASTGSSNEGIGPSKPPPQTRHSKLSIRLPFGRKDKKKSKHDPPPVPPPQFLPPVAEPTGSLTPAVEDDVEPVKQLCGMGFSRTQAVTALEKHGYDVQRALNSLLGAP